MKKLAILSTFMAAVLFAFAANAAETIKLPKPSMKGGKPLLEMINNRHSMRDFSSKEIDNQTMSEIFWSAWGVNSGGKRTIPTARNQQNLKVFAFMPNGVWFYNAQDNTLEQITDVDHRNLLAQQEYVMDAPLTIVYVGSDKNNSPLHAGSSYQNVGLYAESKGLSAVVRGLIDREGIKKILLLAPDDEVITSITIGWKK